jgi:hypothetical protein
MALTPKNASDSLIEKLSELTREHVKNLQADPDLAAKLDSDPLAQRAYADELFNSTTKPVIDLRDRVIVYDFEESAPASQCWSAIDENTYDGASEGGDSACIGRGPTPKDALLDLLDQFQDPPQRPRASRLIDGGGGVQPPEYAPGTREDWENDDRE